MPAAAAANNNRKFLRPTMSPIAPATSAAQNGSNSAECVKLRCQRKYASLPSGATASKTRSGIQPNRAAAATKQKAHATRCDCVG